MHLYTKLSPILDAVYSGLKDWQHDDAFHDYITTLDKTSGTSPGEMVTIYRGAPNSQTSIVPGDFITTNRQLANDYAGNGKVLSKKVPASHILDDKTEPLGEEYIYRPPSPSIPKELQPLAAEARKFKSAEEFVSSYKKSIKSQAAFEDYLDTFNSGVKDGDKLRGDLFSDAYFRRTTLPQKELISTEITDGSRVRYWKAKIQGGDRTPVLVDKTDNGYTITDGNHKLQAYKSLKINDVPVIIRYETDQLADLWHKATWLCKKWS